MGANSSISHPWLKVAVILASFEKLAVAALNRTVCFVTNFCTGSFCPWKNSQPVDANGSTLEAPGRAGLDVIWVWKYFQR